MRTQRFFLSTAAAAAVTALAVVTIQAAQRDQAPPQAIDPVVAELRALRADLNERLDATIKSQLLVARLSVQEQRTNEVVRKLQEIDFKLRDNESTKEQVTAGMKMFGDLTKNANAQDNPVFAPLQASMERIEKADADLRAQQAELMRQVAQEQGRWSAINARLEELEQMIFSRKK